MTTSCQSLRTFSLDARVVDYDCNPVTGYEVVLLQGKGPTVPYGGGTTLIDVRTSDKDGFIEFDMLEHPTSVYFRAYDKDKTIHDWPFLRDIPIRNRGYYYLDGKPVTYDDLSNLKATSKDNPFYIYVPADERMDLRIWDDNQLTQMIFEDRISRVFPGNAQGRTSPLVIHTYVKEDKPVLEIIGIGNGGVQKMPEKRTVPTQSPHTGYQKSIKVFLKHGRYTQSFYVLGHNRRWTTLLYIDLDFDVNTMSASSNIYTQTITVKEKEATTRETEQALFHPVEQCGGPLSRGPNGHYATLTDDKRRWIRAKHKNIGLNRQEEALLQILSVASDPKTETSWIKDQIESRTNKKQEKDAIRIAMAALNNNSDQPIKIEMLYELALKNSWGSVIKRIAQDHRTPANILTELLEKDMQTYSGIISRNYGADDSVVNWLLDNMPVMTPEDEFAFLGNLAQMNNATPKTRSRVFERSETDNWSNVHFKLLHWPENETDTLLALAKIYLREQPGEGLIQHLRIVTGKNQDFREAWLERLQDPAETAAYTTKQKALLEKIWRGVNWDIELTPKDIEKIENLMQILERGDAQWLAEENWEKQEAQIRLKVILKDTKTENQNIVYNMNWSRGESQSLATNPFTPTPVLRGVFLYAEDRSTIERLAGHHCTPADVLEKIEKEEYTVADGMPQRRMIETALFCNPSYDQSLRDSLPYRLNADCRQIEQKYDPGFGGRHVKNMIQGVRKKDSMVFDCTAYRDQNLAKLHPEIEIQGYGKIDYRSYFNDDSLGGEYSIAESSDKLNAESGMLFGVIYLLGGSEYNKVIGREARIEQIVIGPDGETVIDGLMSSSSRVESEISDNEVFHLYHYYGFYKHIDDVDAIAKGRWLFRLQHNGDVLAEQAITVQ